MADTTIEELKIIVSAETAKATEELDGLKSKVEKLTSSIGGGGGAGAAKGLNAATSILGGSLGSLTSVLSKLGPKGSLIVAAIGLATKAMKEATRQANEYQQAVVQLMGKVRMGTSDLRDFTQAMNDAASNSSVSRNDLSKFFAITKNSFTDSSQMTRDSGFAEDLISYYGDVNTAAKVYQQTLLQSAEDQKKIRDYMAQANNYVQDTGQKGLEGIKKNLSEILAKLGTIVFQLLNPAIQMVKMLTTVLNEVLGLVVEIFDAFSGITGNGTVDQALQDAAENAGDAADAMDRLNDDMDDYNSKLSGMDEISTLDNSNTYGAAAGPDMAGIADEAGKTLSGLSINTAQFQFIFDGVKEVIGLVKTVLEPVLKSIKAIIEPIQKATTTIFEKLSGLLKSVLEPIGTLLGTIMGLITGVLAPVIDMIASVIGRVAEFLGAIIESVSSILGTVMEILVDALEPTFAVLSEVFGIITEVLGVLFEILFDVLEPIFEVVEEVFEVFAEIFGMLGEIFSTLMEAIKPILDVILSVVHTIFEAFKPILEILGKMFSGPLGAIFKILGEIVKIVADVLSPVFKVLGAIVEGVGVIIKEVINFLIDGVNLLIRLINSITDGLSKVWTWLGIPAIPKIPEIKRLATGGSAEAGELVQIRENGPELISYGGGRMEVMNNDQIMQSVAAGVAEALRGVDFGGGDVRLFVDGYEMNTRLEKAKQRAGTLNLGKTARQGGY